MLHRCLYEHNVASQLANPKSTRHRDPAVRDLPLTVQQSFVRRNDGLVLRCSAEGLECRFVFEKRGAGDLVPLVDHLGCARDDALAANSLDANRAQFLRERLVLSAELLDLSLADVRLEAEKNCGQFDGDDGKEALYEREYLVKEGRRLRGN